MVIQGVYLQIMGGVSVESDKYEDVVKAAQQIFQKEATLGLGDFKKRKPQQVSEQKYDELLKSGDYIEVFHGGAHDITGKYYVNNDLHVNGFGYYFSYNDSTASSYTNGGSVVSALIKKSDIMSSPSYWSSEHNEGVEKYIGKNATFKNGKEISNSYKHDLYNSSTLAARKGFKVVESNNSAVVVVDRSVLIMKKK